MGYCNTTMVLPHSAHVRAQIPKGTTVTQGPLMLIVPPTGPAHTEHLPEQEAKQVARLQELVGGWIEAIGVPGAWHAYCNEEGKLHGQQFNDPAQILALYCGWQHRGDYLVGPVVFLGTEGTAEADVPAGILDAARSLGVLNDRMG